ncbi:MULTISPECIES: DNA cytosine methyltransferase [unclassified Serratia (in: enterobacteria)]|uniref:DNA cytosine methyltransferase n=1 Tax=unclassified Serratia (in: enterobacteria) TaxID=2647522 RepID=UPI0004693FE3|nr:MULTISPECIES: DNA (cytosine-5-)-methyltransferase [unclassified Serratia (in: enterobacteria)]
MDKSLHFLDLFAGAGGLSEEFIRAGFTPVAHVESNKAACFTLRTRAAYHWLTKESKLNIYEDYLRGEISRNTLYKEIPAEIIESVINEEIKSESLSEIFTKIDNSIKSKKIDIIIGGPPCQAYSLVGRSRSKNRMIGDKRNYLFTYYVKFLERYQPNYFVFENVTGLLSAKDENGNLYFNIMRELFRAAGYQTEYKILSTDEYGIPQARKRVILVGKKGSTLGFYPEPDKLPIRLTVDDVFSDLPKLLSGHGEIFQYKEKKPHSFLIESELCDSKNYITWHTARPHTQQDLEIYRIAVEKWNNGHQRIDYNSLPTRLKTHRQRVSFLDRFKVVAGDLHCSHTIVAHIAKDGHYYIHPDISQNRSLTPREAARLQTFPDNYFFESASGKPSRTAAFLQIGNAVPVLLAEKLALKIKSSW